MNRIFTTTLAFITLSAAYMTATAEDYIPEPPRNQNAVYNETDKSVTISAVAPSKTEYDWDNWYEPQKDLPYISYILVERHTPGTSWGNNPEIGRVENPALGETFTFIDKDVEEDAKYEYRLTCYVDNTKGTYSSFVSVYTGVIPGALKEFTASVADHKSTVVDITVTAPELTASGNPLTANFCIEIVDYVDWQEIPLFTIEDAEPGMTYTWQDTDREIGKSCHYRAYARVGANGTGERSEADTYVGLDVPGEPVNLTCIPDGECAHISWDQPIKGYRGGYYNPDATTYTITRTYLDGSKEIAARKVNETEWTDNPGFDEACTVTYSVTAVNEAGESYKSATHSAISFGRPATLPFTESFSDESLDHRGWTFETTQNDPYYTYNAWIFPDESQLYYFPTDLTVGVPSHDSDHGLAECLFYGHSEEGQTESLISPAILTTGIDGVNFCFHYFEVCAEASLNEIIASVSRDNGEWEPLFVSVPADDVDPGWTDVNLPIQLDGEAESIRLRIDAIRHTGPIVDIFIDNISVKDSAESGIRDTLADTDSMTPAVYYNIQGVRIENPTVPGIYIIKRGNNTSKVLVK